MRESSGVLIGVAGDLASGSGTAVISLSGVTVSSSSSGLSISAGADKYALDPHAAENVNVTGYQSETFSLGVGFGAETIQGFSAGSGSSDVLSLGLSMFTGLSASNTAAQDVAILISNNAMAQSGSNVTITDKSGDVLTLLGVRTTTLLQDASNVFKFS